MLRDLQRERDAKYPFSQERLDNALARKRAIYPEDSKPVKYEVAVEEVKGDNNQQNARPKEILKPGEENFSRTDEFESSLRAESPADKKIEDMFARSMAWHYLKQSGIERPKVTIMGATDPAAKIDVEKMKEQRSTLKRPTIAPKSSRRLNVAQEPKIFKKIPLQM